MNFNPYFYLVTGDKADNQYKKKEKRAGYSPAILVAISFKN
jgi:hypothetical protein